MDDTQAVCSEAEDSQCVPVLLEEGWAHVVETGFVLGIYAAVVYNLVTYLHVNAVFQNPASTESELTSAVETYRNMAKLQTFFITYTFLPLLHHLQIALYKYFLGEQWTFDIKAVFDLVSVEIRIQQTSEVVAEMSEDAAVISQEIAYSLLFFLKDCEFAWFYCRRRLRTDFKDDLPNEGCFGLFAA